MSTLKLGLGFTAEFEQYDDSNNCYISKLSQGGSLQMVAENGCLDPYAGNPIMVPDDILERATKWAESLGY
jgi:hypothetical protein|tara:strand:+ start:594 stop:806 length:213 start_codon:yes stop_codon:yes gene_type:complete